MTFYGYSQNDPTNPYDNVPAYAVVNGYFGLRDPHGAWELTFYRQKPVQHAADAHHRLDHRSSRSSSAHRQPRIIA